MIDLFQSVKSHVSPIDFAEQNHLNISRGNMILCPFHQEHTPSLKLYDDHFYCFGCHTSGDVIALASGFWQLSPCETARRLAADFGISPEAPPGRIPISKPFSRTMLCQHNLAEYFFILSKIQRTMAPQKPDDPLSPLFVKSCQELAYVEYLMDAITLLPEATIAIMDTYGLNEKIARELSLLEKEGYAA